MPSHGETRLYIGNLPANCTEKEIGDIFNRYGKIESLSVKNPSLDDHRSSSFAFIKYEDPADADHVVRRKNGMRYDGRRIRVEFPHGKTAGSRGRERYYVGRHSSHSSYGRRGQPYGNRDKVQRSRYRLQVTGLPSSGSWQDLKDHMREVGEVCFADVTKLGTGVVEFFTGEHMKLALKKMDNTKFRSHEGDIGYIRLTLDEIEKPRRRSRTRSRSRSYDRRFSNTRNERHRRSRRSPISSTSTSPPIVDVVSKRSRSRSRSPVSSHKCDE